MFYVIRIYHDSTENAVKSAVYVHDDYTAAKKQFYRFASSDIDDPNKDFTVLELQSGNGNTLEKMTFNIE